MGELQASPLCARAATRAAEVVDARLAQATDEVCDPPTGSETGTENRVPNAASAARAPPGAQAPPRSACCSAESTRTTPPRVLSSRSPLSNTRYLEPHIRTEMVISAAKRLRTRPHARSARITRLRASKKANSNVPHRQRKRRPKTRPLKSTQKSSNPQGRTEQVMRASPFASLPTSSHACAKHSWGRSTRFPIRRGPRRRHGRRRATFPRRDHQAIAIQHRSSRARGVHAPSRPLIVRDL